MLLALVIPTTAGQDIQRGSEVLQRPRTQSGVCQVTFGVFLFWAPLVNVLQYHDWHHHTWGKALAEPEAEINCRAPPPPPPPPGGGLVLTIALILHLDFRLW